MTIQILVPLLTYPDGNSANITKHVAGIARHLGGDVHGLVLNAIFPRVSSLLGGMIIDVEGLAQNVTARCRSRGAALVLAMEASLNPIGVKFRSTQLDCLMGTIEEAASTYPRYHDLTVVGLSPTDGSLKAAAESVIFGSGRPTLVVQQDAPPASYQHVVIAWDGSQVATRAVADARDFLRLANAVTIASVTDEKELPEKNPGHELAAYLARHDIPATVTLLQTLGRPIGGVLQDHALNIGADMMVMGAFGHSRMRDFVMGGATAGILQDLKLPVLLSH